MNKLTNDEFYSDNEDDSVETNNQLPIYKSRLQIIEAVRNNQFVIIHGETGCGKTTQVPQYLYHAGIHEDSAIGITQPRRLAAVSMAKRVAEEMHVPIGKTVGYEIRFNKKSDASTKIKYMTDGILLNECIINKKLTDYKVIMIDEAHERSVISDVLLGLLKKIAQSRDDLKVIISSATINVDKFANYFNNAKIISVESRLFSVDVIYEDFRTDYIVKTGKIVQEIHQREIRLQEEGNTTKGDVLVFLTGQEEIYMCCEELYQYEDVVAMPLCSTIDVESQNAIFEKVKPYQTKVVIATNIAETSITIKGIKYVIDCGYVKQNKYNPRRGMEVLEDVRISKAQAEQRRGRAGRTRDGICHRLYNRITYDAFQDEAVPEIQRKNLSGIYLMLRALNQEPMEFDFMDPPTTEELIRSKQELIELSLLTPAGELTAMGSHIAALPLGPILGKVLMTSIQYKCTADVVTIVAMFSEKMHNIFRRPRNKIKAADAKKCQFYDPDGDHFMLLKLYKTWKSQRDSVKWCHDNFIDVNAMNNIKNVINQIRFILKRSQFPISDTRTETNREDIKKCFVAGYFRNICLKQPRDVYSRVFDEEVFYMYGNSCLKDVRPQIVLFHDAIKSTRSFASGVLQLDEDLLRTNFKNELELIKFPDDIDEPISF